LSHRILVVIVNFRTPELTLGCLQSLEPEVKRVPGTHVVVVENGSGDGSREALESGIAERGYGDWVTLVVSPENLGFAGGNNLGIRHGEPAKFVLLLNSDTIVHEGCLERCLEVMKEHPRAGAMSCRVLNADGTNQNVARRFPTPLRTTFAATGLPWKFPSLFGWADTEDSGWDRSTTARDVDWLGGAFLFLRSAAFDGKVRLDEDFFFYGEDVALCFELARRGWARRYDPVKTIVHLGGASSDPSRLPSGKRAELRLRARYLLFRKCFGIGAEGLVRSLDLGFTGARFLRAVASPARRQQAAELKAQLGHMLR
jgi:N-acetylglucosaminyl-diphospho-decaprenol L-rhamnosyltransferase